jgi:hypothetical protein
LRFADCGFDTDALRQSKIRNQKSKIVPETPRRGQSAECPDRLIKKKRLISRRIFSE